MSSFKNLYFLRHGQALHNVRAEPLRAAGCSFEDFMKQMKADDALDACLTDEGEEQAKAASMKREVEEAAKNLQLVVASPLSRAIDTANLVFPPSLCPLSPKRLILEEVREINGLLLNGQRRTKSVIEQLYPSWDCSRLTTEEDESWTEHELEGDDSVRGRGLTCLEYLWGRSETEIAVVAHGGFFRKLMNDHDNVRTNNGLNERFSNCQLKAIRMERRDDGVFQLGTKT